MMISAHSIRKSFGDYSVLKDVNLHVKHGEFVALLGPSGSGKTTLLRIIAGLESSDHGEILLSGQDASKQSTRERNVGFVFQHYALFRHMTVFENVAFGLRVKPRAERPSEEHIRRRVNDLLKLVQIEWFANHFPSQLSGGQRQRVALARALAIEPKVLLLDEPFGALDAKVRKELRRWLRKLHDEMGITSIFVTHDQEEAMEMADRVVVMNDGAIVQEGTPADVYHSPRTPFVYEFLGNVNRFECVVSKGKAFVGSVEFDAPEYKDTLDARAVLYVRPHEMSLKRTRSKHALEGVIHFISSVGALVRIELKMAEQDRLVEVALPHTAVQELGFTVGDRVFAQLGSYRVFFGE